MIIDIYCIITRHNQVTSYENLLCILKKDCWVVHDHLHVYYDYANAEIEAKASASFYACPYLGIKNGYHTFPFDEAEWKEALLNLQL